MLSHRKFKFRILNLVSSNFNFLINSLFIFKNYKTLSGESDASNRLFNYRRLTDHFNLQHAQRERNLNKLRAHSRQLIEFSRSIGLKIKQIFLTKRNENDFDDSIKIFVKENDVSQEEIEFRCLVVKEISCLSRRKYQVLKRTLDFVFPIKMPGIEKLFSLQIVG